MATKKEASVESPTNKSDRNQDRNRNEAARDHPGLFMFCSSNNLHTHWLADALEGWQVVQQELISPDLLVALIAASGTQPILLDFSGNCGDSVANCGVNMIALAQALRSRMPERPLIAVGTMAYPEGAIAALRAGISHFIDMSASASEAREIVHKLISATPHPAKPQHGALVALIGARAGVGATTLAVHLADLLRQSRPEGQPPCRVGLLDLGLPAGDGQLYLNASGDFHFLDAVHNRHRLDQTLIQTALTHSSNGVTVIPLPRNMRTMHEMNDIPDVDVLALLMQLRLYFDVLIMDLGGYTDPAFALKMANAADQSWFVTDQSAGALVSLAALLAKFGKREGDTHERHLVVNRYDKDYGVSAQQIAERFNLRLKAVIPDRTLGLMSSASQGKLLHEVNRRDPYIRAVEELVGAALQPMPAMRPAGMLARWAPGLFKR